MWIRLQQFGFYKHIDKNQENSSNPPSCYEDDQKFDFPILIYSLVNKIRILMLTPK